VPTRGPFQAVDSHQPPTAIGRGLVAAGGVDGELAEELAGGGVDDLDLQVLDEQYNAGSGVGSADADVMQAAAQSVEWLSARFRDTGPTCRETSVRSLLTQDTTRPTTDLCELG
jgi:hypothetical protein